ncbi:MAG: group II intron reverse transcriptase/maturase [Syntrophaceae bacterium]|nr:group II intron reverse transcriptase/maturase [Syntrophaceae bacterium]
MNKAKPFCISKWEVWEAYKLVKSNKGAAGVDGQSIAEFEEDVKDNLFKIWNRMSSGSYFPPPVRRVDIPKDNGRTRPLGIPTVADRIAQTVVKRYLEPILEECFYPDSYGYRPRKSAIEAIGVARQRCWRYDWVLDLDIKGFFDNIDHDLLMRAVRKHTDCKWVLLYIERWLKAPAQLADGSLINRDKGTPQGGVVSPLLANLFLHYAFDLWMKRQYPQIPFERYADDGICHCRSKAEAERLRMAIEKRFAECGLELNLQKTKIVYCKDDERRGNYPDQKFDFLGFTFRPRRAKDRWGRFFVTFTPAISNKAKKSICDTMRQWNLHRRTDKSLDEIAKMINPVLKGWINYYGCFRKSALRRTFQPVNNSLVHWASRKYKRLRWHKQRAFLWLECIVHRQPRLFAHWQLSQSKAGQ